MRKIKKYSKLVYVIGPFRAKTDNERIHNIRRAEALTYKLWELGFTALCAHLNTQNMEGLVPIDDILEGDMSIIKRCDFCVATLPRMDPKMLASEGTQLELKYCVVIGKQVYYDLKMVLISEGKPE